PRVGVAQVVSDVARGARATKVPGEESNRAVDFEGGDSKVAAGVGVQGLLFGSERVEQPHDRVPRIAFIVALQPELDRDRDPRRGVGEPVASDEAEDRSGDPRFGRDEADAHLTGLGQAVVPDGLAVADAVQFPERVQGGLPVGYELRRYGFVEGKPRRGGQSTPGTSPTVKSCSRMPSATVSEVMRMAGVHRHSR